MSSAVSSAPGDRTAIGGSRPLMMMDIGLGIALCAGLLIADHSPEVTHGGPAISAVRIAGTIIAALAVVVRRASPRSALAAATVAAAAVAALGGAPQISLCIAVTAYTAATAGEFARWWAPPAAMSTVIAAAVVIGRISGWLAALIASIAIVCVGWFAGQAARERRNRLRVAAEQGAERERQHTSEVRQAAIDERLVIARELHDIVAHAMSVIAVRSGVARMVMDTDPAEVKGALGIIETTTRQALQEMRLLVEVLRRDHAIDAALAPAPGLADIAALADQVRLAGIQLTLDMQGAARPLPPGVDLSAYRIAQEALTNVVRHAGPTRATLSIEYQVDQLIINVVDDGPNGLSNTRQLGQVARAGHGLIGMRERVALFDGQLHAGRYGAGFQLHATLRTDDATS